MTPGALTLPFGGNSAVGPLLSRYASFLMQGLAQLDRRVLSGPVQEALTGALECLSAAYRADRARLANVVLRQNLSTLANCGLRGIALDEGGGVEGTLAAWIPLVAFELGLEGMLGDRSGARAIAWGRAVPTLFSIARDVRLDADAPLIVEAFGEKGIVFRARAGGTTLECGWSDVRPGLDRDGIRCVAAFPSLGGRVRLALHDNNPLIAIEQHPEKKGNALDLGGRPVAEWTRALIEALALVDVGLPEVRREMDSLGLQVVPVGYDSERHLSASYMENIGTAYLSLHPNVLTMAEALVHEFQHNKLNLARNLDAVLTNGFRSLHRSPVRPDPRPLMGVLLAVHAFVPVAQMYLNLRAAGHAQGAGGGFEERLEKIVAGNAEGLSVVRQSAEPSALGAQLIEELSALQTAHEREVGALRR